MKTRFVQISPYTDDFKRMQIFAKSFDHDITPWKNGRVFAFERGEKVYGYADVIYLPVAFPAFHPELTEPRAVLEVMQGWKTYCEIAHDGEGWIAAPTEGHRPSTFPSETVEKLGYAKMNREIYQLTERE
jgi:hypothetical protein